jgi:hypothetical protein
VVAALAIVGIANVATATALVAAAALKNLRLEGVLIPFNVLSFLDIFFFLLFVDGQLKHIFLTESFLIFIKDLKK